jgi:hypothetical protein
VVTLWERLAVDPEPPPAPEPPPPPRRRPRDLFEMMQEWTEIRREQEIERMYYNRRPTLFQRVYSASQRWTFP